jgi:DNA-binding GntR family transcriptional regulator
MKSGIDNPAGITLSQPTMPDPAPAPMTPRHRPRPTRWNRNAPALARPRAAWVAASGKAPFCPYTSRSPSHHSLISNDIEALTDSDTAKRKTSTDTVYDLIRAKILDNEFRPGMQMLEQELVAMFGVSRTPVREALIRLQKEHLVEIVPRHGMRVRQVSLADMQEIYQVLTSLEATAAGLVAARVLRVRELKPFEDACVAMERALASDDLEAWSAADEAFHLHLLALCGNPRLTQIVTEYRDLIQRARFLTLRLGARPDDSVAEHRAIADAIRRSDVQAAQALTRTHRERGIEKQIDTLTRFRLYEL